MMYSKCTISYYTIRKDTILFYTIREGTRSVPVPAIGPCIVRRAVYRPCEGMSATIIQSIEVRMKYVLEQLLTAIFYLVSCDRAYLLLDASHEPWVRRDPACGDASSILDSFSDNATDKNIHTVVFQVTEILPQVHYTSKLIQLGGAGWRTRYNKRRVASGQLRSTPLPRETCS